MHFFDREPRTGKQVEHKIYRIEQKWRAMHKFVTSATGEGIRAEDESTWREKVMNNFCYYYDLEDVYLERAAYQPKATSAGITASGFADDGAPMGLAVDATATSSTDAVSTTNEQSDTDTDTGGGVVPDSVIANLEKTGAYATPTVRSGLTSKSSNTSTTKRDTGMQGTCQTRREEKVVIRCHSLMASRLMSWPQGT